MANGGVVGGRNQLADKITTWMAPPTLVDELMWQSGEIHRKFYKAIGYWVDRLRNMKGLQSGEKFFPRYSLERS